MLKEIREKLEREFTVNFEESNALQRESRLIKDDKLLGHNALISTFYSVFILY